MKLRIKRGETLKKLKSIRVKLFITLCAVLIVIIVFFVLLNNFMLENFYVYSKQRTLMNVYNKINNFYNQNLDESSVEFELEKIALNNDFDIANKIFGLNLKFQLKDWPQARTEGNPESENETGTEGGEDN